VNDQMVIGLLVLRKLLRPVLSDRWASPCKWGLVVLRGRLWEPPHLLHSKTPGWRPTPISKYRYRWIILLGFEIESSGALDKACLWRLKGVWRAPGQGKVSSRSPLAANLSLLLKTLKGWINHNLLEEFGGPPRVFVTFLDVWGWLADEMEM
jgi:hypothetical protein